LFPFEADRMTGETVLDEIHFFFVCSSRHKSSGRGK
jgi:hypothetical protein